MNTALPAANLARRLGAMLYDSLLLFGVWFVASAAALLVTGGTRVAQGNPFFTLYLLVVTIAFFGWFWTHGGQTLGMRTWRIRVVNNNGQPVSWPQAVIRCLVAIPALLCGGLGYWWILWDKERKSWGDHASGTRVVALPKR